MSPSAAALLKLDPAAWLRDKAERRVAADLRNEGAARATLELLDELDELRRNVLGIEPTPTVAPEQQTLLSVDEHTCERDGHLLVAGGTRCLRRGCDHVVDVETQRNQLGGFRSTDPSTSRRAAIDNYPRSGSQRQRVLEAVSVQAASGMTASELERMLSLPYQSVSTRLSELVRGGWLETRTDDDGELVTRTSSLGSEQRVLWATQRAYDERTD